MAASCAAETSPARNGGVWPFQDGSLVVAEKGGEYRFLFPYVPFLETEPSWNPAYPQAYGQSGEPVAPLLGLGGQVRIGAAREGGEFAAFSPENMNLAERGPHYASWTTTLDEGPGRLEWATSIGRKGVVFSYRHDGSKKLRLRIESHGHAYDQVWAKPGTKQRHNWGKLDWSTRTAGSTHLVSRVYGNPVDATHSPRTLFWFRDSLPGELVTHTEGHSEKTAMEITLEPKSTLEFGFLHADNKGDLEFEVTKLADRKTAAVESDKAAWEAWWSESVAAIRKKLGDEVLGESANSLAHLKDEDRWIAEGLVRTRLLSLSNGALLSRPITATEAPRFVRDQAVAMNHWDKIGLDIPNPERWRDLARFNPRSERSIPIYDLSGSRTEGVFGRGNSVILSPDPEFPPSKRMFDAILGYVISGGRVTLIDGVAGFEGKTGWWTEADARDPADYALRVLGLDVNRDSRKILDAPGLDPEVNTFCAGAVRLATGRSEDYAEAETVTPEPGGYLLFHPRSSETPEGAALSSVLGHPTQSTAEASILAASFDPRVDVGPLGEPRGRKVIGEGYLAYRLPEDTTLSVRLRAKGDWVLAWSGDLPVNHQVFQKKAYQSWYFKQLVDLNIPKLAHPVVYEATFGIRVYDATGTNSSPFLYHKLNKGSFIWIGFPRDLFRLGSDAGTDRQTSLREDPTYDLLRMTLSLHDPDRGGGQQASAVPEAGWTSNWNEGSLADVRPDLAYFAWLPTRSLGTKAGGNTYWARTLQSFDRALQNPLTEGLHLNAGPLVTTDLGEAGRGVDLYANACAYATYKDLSRHAGYRGLTWWRNRTAGRAAAIEAELVGTLDLLTDRPLYGRKVAAGSATEELPVADLLPGAVYAVTEIEDGFFPGGKEARQNALSRLVSEKDLIREPRHRAALATVLPVEEKAILEDVVSNEGAEFDLATVLPAIHATLRWRAMEAAPPSP